VPALIILSLPGAAWSPEAAARDPALIGLTPTSQAGWCPTVVTEPMREPRGVISMIERIRITDAGRRAIKERWSLNPDERPKERRHYAWR
jgi:hypothetical protein